MDVTADRPGERGLALLWAIALMNALLLVATAVLAIGAQALQIARVGAIADLAALAGAQAESDACAAAGLLAATNGVRLARCDVAGPDVVVEVQADPLPLARRFSEWVGREPGPIAAIARAGAPDELSEPDLPWR